MSAKKQLSLVRNLLVFTLIGWFLLSFMVVPVISVFRTTFFASGTFSVEAIGKLATSGRIVKSLANTYLMALCTVVTVTIVGMFQILVTEYFAVRGARWMEIVFMSPLVYGGISLVTGYNYVYSAHGAVTNLLARVFPGMNVNWFTGFYGRSVRP